MLKEFAAREQILSFKSSLIRYGKMLFQHHMICLEYVQIHSAHTYLRICVMEVKPLEVSLLHEYHFISGRPTTI